MRDFLEDHWMDLAIVIAIVIILLVVVKRYDGFPDYCRCNQACCRRTK